MSTEDLEKFKKMVLKSSDLQERLKEAANQEDFVELAIRMGQENRLSFTTEELAESLEEQNQKLANMTFGEKVIDQIKISFYPRSPIYYWGLR